MNVPFDEDPASSARSTRSRIARALTGVLYALGGATIVFMMLFVVASALSRTLRGSQLPASLEIVQYLLMPGLAALGFIAATLAHRHIVADILYGAFPRTGRKWLVVANASLSAATLAVLVLYTWNQAMLASARGVRAGYTDIPAWPLYFAISVSLAVSTLLFLRDACRQARKPAEAFETGDGAMGAADGPSAEDVLVRARKAGEL